MIRPININLNAAHPELKLLETVTYTGSPSSVFIRGIPPNYGRWAITAVFVAASFPDGSTTTRAAVRSADGVWVATLPATATSGRTENGFRVIADGIDENGEAVTGYIIAVADFAVASLDVTPAPEPGETSYQMLYFDEVPSTLRKGDVAKIDGVLKFYNGSAWEPFAAPVPLDDAVTRTSANGVKSSGIWATVWGALTEVLPTGFSSLYDWCVSQLAGKQATINDLESIRSGAAKGATALQSSDVDDELSDKSENPVQNKVVNAAIDKTNDNIAPEFDAEKPGGYEVGDLVRHSGVLYHCTTAHTGAWDADDFEETTVAAAIAQGGQTDIGLSVVDGMINITYEK